MSLKASIHPKNGTTFVVTEHLNDELVNGSNSKSFGLTKTDGLTAKSGN